MAKAKDERTDLATKKVAGVETDFLAKYTAEDHSHDGMENYRVVPRLKVLQGLSDAALKKAFGEGAIIIRPGDVEVWKDGSDPVLIVPLFFWVEFAKWRALGDKGNGSPVVELSYDPLSDIAKKARDPELRTEEYPDQDKKKEKDRWNYRYVEHLRFVVMIYGDHPLAGTPVALSFEKGEFGTGKNFISAIKMRKMQAGDKRVPMPLWSQVWSMQGAFNKKSDDRQWYGVDLKTAEPSVIKPEEAEDFRSLHLELKDLHEKKRLRVDDEQEVEDPDKGGKAEY